MKTLESRKGYNPVTIQIYIKGRGIVLDETSLVAIDQKTSKIVAVGAEARNFEESDDQEIMISCPLRWGIIADYTATVKMFGYFLDKAIGHKSILGAKPKVTVCIPKGTTEVERVAFRESFCQLRARNVFISESTLEETISDPATNTKIIIGIVPLETA